MTDNEPLTDLPKDDLERTDDAPGPKLKTSKPKRPLTEKQLAVLKKGQDLMREKSALKKAQNDELIKKSVHSAVDELVEKKLSSAPKATPKSKKVIQIVQSDSESDNETEIVYVKKAPKKTTKARAKKVVYVDDDESEEEAPPKPARKPRAKTNASAPSAPAYYPPQQPAIVYW